MIIDTHCHVYNSEMENTEEIIKKSAENKINLILNGIDLKTNEEVLNLSKEYDNVYAALGYFYTLADSITDKEISLLDKQLNNDKVIAVGEIGLDYYNLKDKKNNKENKNNKEENNEKNKEKQKELFEKMLKLAEKHDLPVIVHSRKAIQDTYNIIKKHNVVGSLHSYQGSAEMANEFIKLGFYIGIGGTITHKNNKKARKTVNKININNILLETDSPYLSPEEKREEKNTPLNLKYIIKKIAKELDIEEKELIKITTKNAEQLFKIQ